MRDRAAGNEAASRLTALGEELRRKKSEQEEQRKELAVLIKQTMAELERATQRSREASSHLKQIENSIDSLSATEIRRAYGSTQEAQMRQFMMQTQLEQFRNRQASLDTSDDLLRQVLSSIDELLEVYESSAETGGAGGSVPSQSEEAKRALEGASVTFRGIELVLQRLSRQLQDETSQTLSDLILRAEVCERLVDMDKQKAKTEMNKLKQAAAMALRSTRQTVQELRSPALDESGLATALRRYVETAKSVDRVQVDLHITGVERPLPKAAELAAFRIVQEALSNVVSHSGTKRAEVRLRYEPRELLLTVADEGQGFDVESTAQRLRSLEHSGLLDMQVRSELIGATLDVDSKPGNGCTVTLTIPA